MNKRTQLLEKTARTLTKRQKELLAKAADVLIKLAEKCGGPGSGVPGPCPGPRSGAGGGGYHSSRDPTQHDKPASKPAISGKPPKRKPSTGGYKPDKDPTQSDKPNPKAPLKIIDPKDRAHVDSMAKHLSEEGRKKLETGGKITSSDFTPERQALHKQIIDSHFEGKTPVKNPVAFVLGGGPASGKSSIIKHGHVAVEKNSIHVDSDAIKTSLPEYNEMLKAGDSAAAPYVHEESSYLAKQIQDRGSKGSYNTLLDGTGNSSMESLAGKIQKMKAAGQRVVAAYVTVPTEMAIDRNRERAKKTGRLPPETMLRACHKSVSKVLPAAIEKGLFDEIQVFDTTDGVKKIASAKGSELQIHDKGLWETFKAKANE